MALGCVSLSGCQAAVPAPVSERSPVPGGSQQSYVVKAGDTLYSVAFRYRLDFNQLATWNDLTAPYGLRPGQRLYLKPTEPQSAEDQPAEPERVVTPVRGTADPVPSVGVPKKQWRWPVASTPAQARRLVLRGFGNDSLGLDFRLAQGEPVRAAAAGPVVYAGSGLGGYAYLVILRHGTRYLSAYGFNGRLRVREGQSVKVGERLADIESNGAHNAALHFEIRDRGAPIDPRQLLP